MQLHPRSGFLSHLHTPCRWGSMMLSDSKDEAGIGEMPSSPTALDVIEREDQP